MSTALKRRAWGTPRPPRKRKTQDRTELAGEQSAGVCCVLPEVDGVYGATRWAQRARSRVSGVHNVVSEVSPPLSCCYALIMLCPALTATRRSQVTDYLTKHLLWIESSRVNTGSARRILLHPRRRSPGLTPAVPLPGWTKENRELAYALLRVASRRSSSPHSRLRVR